MFCIHIYVLWGKKILGDSIKVIILSSQSLGLHAESICSRRRNRTRLHCLRVSAEVPELLLALPEFGVETRLNFPMC